MEKLSNNLGCLRNQKGVSLVEILVTVLLFTVLMGVALGILTASSDSWTVNQNKTQLQQELRKAADWIKDDLRQTSSAGITNVPADGTTKTTITFYKANGGASGGTIVWSTNYYDYVVNSNQLQRITHLPGGSTTTQVISQWVSAVQFQRTVAAPNIVVVNLIVSRNLGKGGTITQYASSKIKLRF